MIDRLSAFFTSLSDIPHFVPISQINPSRESPICRLLDQSENHIYQTRNDNAEDPAECAWTFIHAYVDDSIDAVDEARQLAYYDDCEGCYGAEVDVVRPVGVDTVTGQA